jgi:hypothetical protein
MEYDWSGVGTRRRRWAKAFLYVVGAIVAVTAPVFLLPGADLSALTLLVEVW